MSEIGARRTTLADRLNAGFDVLQLSTQVVTNGGTTACSTCGGDVTLTSPHRTVVLERSASELETHVFCDETCFDEWSTGVDL